jgi:hypothetical protein
MHRLRADTHPHQGQPRSVVLNSGLGLAQDRRHDPLHQGGAIHHGAPLFQPDLVGCGLRHRPQDGLQRLRHFGYTCHREAPGLQ